MIKYSIIVPVKNSLKYLPECIRSVTHQDYTDYELIISDDHSEDGTKEYLATINHPHIKIIHTDDCLTLTNHFNFAIQHATGEWLMALGGDDGLQSYFFKLADELTDIATKKNIRAIGSRRSYFFWDGCQEVYGDTAVAYYADFHHKYQIRYSEIEIIKTLLGNRDSGYYSLPQMYTTSLFHNSLIYDAIKLQNGKLLTAAFPDVNLAIISTSLDKKFLESSIPLGWVGTSPRSVFRDEFTVKNAKKIPYICGNFDLRINEIWFWGYLLSVPKLRHPRRNRLISSKIFMLIMFGKLLFMLYKDDYIKKRAMLLDVVKINKCRPSIVIFASFIFKCFRRLTRRPFHFIARIYSKLQTIIYKNNYKYNHVEKRIDRNSCSNITLTEASKMIEELTKNLFDVI